MLLTSTPAPCSRTDGALGLALATGVVLYLAALPRYPAVADEAVYLLEARRVFDGEIPYRDFFELATPGWLYFIATLFWLFGPTLTTARIGAAVIQALIAALLFLTCRRVGVCRQLALATAVAHVVIAQAIFPIASQHWLVTLLAVTLLFLLCRSGATGPGRWFVAGVVIALMVETHQARGIGLGLGVAAFLAADVILAQRCQIPPGQRPAFGVAAAALGGGLLIALITFLPIVLAAGLDATWQALILQPLVNYHGAIRCGWGHGVDGRRSLPDLVRHLPWVLVLTGFRLAVLCLRRDDYSQARTLLLLFTFGCAAISSIWYYPDFIHIALITCIFLIAIAEATEWLIKLSPERLQSSAAWIVASIILIGSGGWLQQRYLELQGRHPVAYRVDTSFGRYDFRHGADVQLLERLREFLREEPPPDIYCHPSMSWVCLALGQRNPTRFEVLLNGYSSPSQYQEAIDALTDRQVEYIVAVPAFVAQTDPLGIFMRRYYTPLSQESSNRYIWHRTKTPTVLTF